MRLVYFLDIPVYRLTQEQYMSSWEKSSSYEVLKTVTHENRVSAQEALIKIFGGQWEYNEIIGYIKLYFQGTQIRGEYFKTYNKRIKKTRRKVFKYSTHNLAIEIELRKEYDNKQIFDAIKNYLRNCQKELKNKVFIDTSRLDALGPYVDWVALFQEK